MRLLMSCRESYRAAEDSVRKKWNRALFKALYVGEGQIKRFEYKEPFESLFAWAGSNNEALVARSGFEPLISALRGLHPRPLDERAGE